MTNVLTRSILLLTRRYASLTLAALALVVGMSGTWRTADAAPSTEITARVVPEATDTEPRPPKKREVTGKLNLNTATEAQLMLLPSVGPAKAERIVAWRKRNGGFKRVADLRRVKGFGFKTLKRLEPLLDIKGDTTLVPK